jgi:hypothetical protein
MPRAKWKTNLVNAFPIPEDRKPKPKKTTAVTDSETATTEEDDNKFKPKGTFPFLSLPTELRYKIINLILFNDADPLNPQRTTTDDAFQELLPSCKTISLLLANRAIHAEASHILYSSTTFRLFALQDFLSLPTPPDLAPHYRSHITRLSLILGSSWTAPPKHWRVGKGLARCLSRLKLVRVLRVFVQLDPSIPMFEKHRVSFAFYTDFCGALLADVLKAMPWVEAVEVAGYRHVDPRGPLVSRLVKEVQWKGRDVRWDRACGWFEEMGKESEATVDMMRRLMI